MQLTDEAIWRLCVYANRRLGEISTSHASHHRITHPRIITSAHHRITALSQKRITALSLSTLDQLGFAVGKGASLAE
ncbi:MAG: hypothetical protein PHT92_12345, partial [Bacteroidales bacterium]|nr:hypothetical protein [Bacteroidales bacterium]